MSFLNRVLDAFVDDVDSGLTQEGFDFFNPKNREILEKGKSLYEQIS